MKQLFSNKLFIFIQCAAICGSLLLPAASQAAVIKKITPIQLAQPKIISAHYSIKAKSTGDFADKLVWPKEMGTLIEVPSDASSIIVNGLVAAGKTGSHKWAFVPVWSNAEPVTKNFMSDAAATAKKISISQFKTSTKSEPYKVSAKNIGKYLTVYSFVTNGDKITGAPKFPLGIDYASAITFLIIDAQNDEEEIIETIASPSINSLQYDIKAKSTGDYSDKLVWPQEVGTLIEMPSDASVTVSAVAATGKTGTLKWAFVPVWTTNEPVTKNFMTDAAAAAKKVSISQLKANAKSEAYKITTKNIGKYLTVYSFVTNGDKVTGAPKFPLGIDYAGAVTFLVIDAKEYETPVETKNSTQEPAVSKKQPNIGTFSAQKAANSPSGAASKNNEHTVAKFLIKTTTATYLKSIKISVDGNLPLDKTKAISVYTSETLLAKNKLASATFANIALDHTMTLTFKEPQPVYPGQSLTLTLQANTSAANSESWTQFNILGGVVSVEDLEQFQSFPVGGGMISFGGLPPKTTPVTITPEPTIEAPRTDTTPTAVPAPRTDTTPTAEPAPRPDTTSSTTLPQIITATPQSLVVTASVAANSPSGASSKGSNQVIAKFIIKAPQNSANSSAQIFGVTLSGISENFIQSREERRAVNVYRTEQASSANMLGYSSLGAILTEGGSYIQFDTPLVIEAGTYATITVTANTVDASTNSVLRIDLWNAKRISGFDEVPFFDLLNVSGKKLIY